MGRRKSPIPFVKWKINIPVDLHEAVARLTFNPATQTMQYGSRTGLVTALLRKYVEEMSAVIGEVSSIPTSTSIEKDD